MSDSISIPRTFFTYMDILYSSSTVNEHFIKEKLSDASANTSFDQYIKKIFNKEVLDSFKKLEYNWNNNKAEKIPESLIGKSKKILDEIYYQPDIYPTARNSIQLEYEDENGKYLEFEIFEDIILCLFIDRDGKEFDSKIDINDFNKIHDMINLFYE